MDLVPVYLHESFGIQNVELFCVIREAAIPPPNLPQQDDKTTTEKYEGKTIEEVIDYTPNTDI